MPRGLDHIVHAVGDLDAAADLYKCGGFTVGARNRHPWGTHNRIVQFAGVFVELISVGEPELILPPPARSFSFGGFTQNFLAQGEGLSMLALEGKDATGDLTAFHKAGIGHFDRFDFEREARRPDGSTVKVAFSLAFATNPNAPDIGYFTSQQHYPENFWNPAFQIHPNGTEGIAGVTMVANNPADHASFLHAFSGGEVTFNPSGIAAKTPRGEIEVINSTAYRHRFAAELPASTRDARLAAIRFSLPNTAALTSLLAKSGTGFVEHTGNSIVIPPNAAHGAALIFETPKMG